MSIIFSSIRNSPRRRVHIIKSPIHTEDSLTGEDKEAKDLTKNLILINAIFLIFLVIGTLEFPNAQSYLSFASNDPPLNSINPTNSGITTPLSTLVAVAGKTTSKKKSPTSKNFPYLQLQEAKQEPGIQQSGSYNHMNESKSAQRQLFSPLAYGMDETPGSFANSSVHHLKWMDSWEF